MKQIINPKVKHLIIIFIVSFFLLIILSQNVFSERTSPLIIDHNCTDLTQIPDDIIDQVQEKIKWHYSHTSHGGQLTIGLQRIENIDAKYSYSLSTSSLPTESDALCIKDGMTPIRDTYNTPDDYFCANWLRPYYCQELLNLTDYSQINVSGFCFCCQINTYSEGTVDDYLQAMTNLENDNPDITFIYFTGNAQTGPDNHYNQNLDQGYNRFLRNEQIRNYCINNNKVLFDFADIDCWWYNTTFGLWEHATYEYWTGSEFIDVPYEHPHYNLNQAAHTSYENCENKGKAVWNMMAMLSGWNENTKPMITDENPASGLIDVERPPIELNVSVEDFEDDLMDIYFRWKNHEDEWVLLTSFLDVGNGVYKFNPPYENNWIWGDTIYTWSINATDGKVWTNKTFSFTTDGSRYDVNNNNIVNFQDAGLCWTSRTSVAPYDGLYDVNQDGTINFQDAGLTWINRN